MPWVMGSPPSGTVWSITSLPGPGPSSSTHASTSGTGVDGHNLVGAQPDSVAPARPRVRRGAAGRSVPARRSGRVRPEWHVPSRPREGGRDHRASVPRRSEGAVTVGVTAHGVKRFRPAGPGAARGPTRRRGPARRGLPDNAMPCGRRNLPPVGIRAKEITGWGRGVARDEATGLENRRREQQSDGKPAQC